MIAAKAVPPTSADTADTAFKALLKAFSLGLSTAPLADLDDILLALRAMRHDDVLLDRSEVRLLIRREDWIGAVRLLKRLETRQALDQGLSAALLAGCLFKLRDPEWRRYTLLVLRESSSPTALSLVARFLQMPDDKTTDARAFIVGMVGTPA